MKLNNKRIDDFWVGMVNQSPCTWNKTGEKKVYEKALIETDTVWVWLWMNDTASGELS